MPFWAKEKGVGIWHFKGEKNNSLEDGKSKYLVTNICTLCHVKTMRHKEELDLQAQPRSPPTYYT